MKKLTMLSMIAFIALLMQASTAVVNAQDEGKLTVIKSVDKDSAAVGENVTYTYTIINSGTVTAENVTLTDDKLGQLMSGITLFPGENVTTTAVYKVKPSDFWRLKPITNIATVTATGPDGTPILVKSQQVSVVASTVGMFKALILRLSGVPGKGIEKAPGLQKQFNPSAQAAEHAGKKDKPKTPEQLQIRERTENQGTEQQLQTRSRVENQAGMGQTFQDDDTSEPVKGGLKKNWFADNQTQVKPTIEVNNQHKPKKAQPHKTPKTGNQP